MKELPIIITAVTGNKSYAKLECSEPSFTHYFGGRKENDLLINETSYRMNTHKKTVARKQEFPRLFTSANVPNSSYD